MAWATSSLPVPLSPVIRMMTFWARGRSRRPRASPGRRPGWARGVRRRTPAAGRGLAAAGAGAGLPGPIQGRLAAAAGVSRPARQRSPQWVALPEGSQNGRKGQSFVKLLDIIANTMDELFPGMEILETMPFRLTRNADIELDDEPGEDLVELVEEGLRQRRLEDPVRLEYGLPASQPMVNLLLAKLGLTESQAYPMAGDLDYSGLWAIAGLNRPELRDPPWQPVTPPALADENEDIFAAIRKGDVLVHHPFESFDA